MMLKRVVIDTNVLASALMTPTGNPAKVFKMFLAETIVLVYSEEIMFEYEDVLYRPRLRIQQKMLIQSLKPYANMEIW